MSGVRICDILMYLLPIFHSYMLGLYVLFYQEDVIHGIKKSVSDTITC